MIHLIRDQEIEFPEDVSLMSKELELEGFSASDCDIAWAWERYSDEHYAAGWLGIGNPRAAATAIMEYLKPDEAKGEQR